MSGGRGHDLLLSLRADHQEKKLPDFGNEFTALFSSNQRDISRGWHLWYPVQIIYQSNNNSARPGLIHTMSLP